MTATMTALPKRLNFTGLVAKTITPSSVHYYYMACTINVDFNSYSLSLFTTNICEITYRNKPTEEAPSLFDSAPLRFML
jgi:hypothetical protein